MYRCTTRMRQQGTRVLQENPLYEKHGRDRQLDRQIGVTCTVVSLNTTIAEKQIISPWKPKSLEYKYTNTGAIAGCTVLQTSYVRNRGTRKEGPENIREDARTASRY